MLTVRKFSFFLFVKSLYYQTGQMLSFVVCNMFFVYLQDVAYKPEEKFVKTRKCEPEAGANVVKSCER